MTTKEKSTLREGPNPLLLIALALAAVFAFQFPALQMQLHDFDLTVDINAMRHGYEVAQSGGTAHWWFGKWINEASPYFRPVASYAHVAQFQILDRFGFTVLTITGLLLYAALCVLTGAMTWLTSRRRDAAYLAAIGCASMRVGGGNEWLAYFPYADGMLSILFSVATICALLQFSATTAARYLVAAWGCFILSVLCKEAGAFTPVMAGLLIAGCTQHTLRRRILASHLVMMLAAGALLIRYGKNALGRHGMISPFKNYWLTQFGGENVWVLSLPLAALLVLLLAYLLRNRLRSSATRLALTGGALLLMAACVMLAPRNDLPVGHYGVVYLVDNWAWMLGDGVSLLATVALLLALAVLRAPWLSLPIAYFAAFYPFIVSGAAVMGGRLVFVAPFASAAVAFVAALIFAPLCTTLLARTGSWRRWQRAQQASEYS